jgi:hypothetical protein
MKEREIMNFGTAPASSIDQRRSERDEVFLRTTLATAKRSGITVQLVNISAHGFMARTQEHFAEGVPVRVVLPLAGEVSGKVVWSLGGRIGCEFEHPIEAKQYPSILGAIKLAKANWQLG